FGEPIERLTRSYERTNLNNFELDDVLGAISLGLENTNLHFKHGIHGRSRDGYNWFGHYQIFVDQPLLSKGSMFFLFPWAQDWDNPESQLDRGVGAYVVGEVPQETVDQTVEMVAYQLALRSSTSNPVQKVQNSIRSTWRRHDSERPRDAA